MKQTLLIVLFLTFGLTSAQEVTHVDFDENNPNIVFNSWNTSSTFAKISNPAPTANNSSDYVGQFTAGSNNDIGIGVIGASGVFSSPFNLASNAIFKMKVFATEEIDVIFHLENDPDYGNNIEVSASVGTADVNTWVELIFDFSDFSNIFMNNIVIKIGGDNVQQDDIYFFDDIKGPELYSSPVQAYNPLNESVENSITTNLEITTNGSFRNTDDSALSDVSDKVALRIGDVNGADVSFSASINGAKNKITIDPIDDLSNANTYWYGIIDNVIEYSNDTAVVGVAASFTTKAAVIGDLNEMLFDFDTTNENIGFESWGSAGYAKVVNPDPSGINVSENVAKYSHGGDSSGLENELVSDATPLTPFDFSETPFIKVKVWVNKPVSVSVKLQNYPDYGQGHEQKLEVTEINTWVELVFNYGAITATNYDRVQIYFDKDMSGGSIAGDIYYFDDYLKSNVAPAVINTITPAADASSVAQFVTPTISSNFQFRNIDNTTITDISPMIELRETNASGALVAMNASLNDTNSVITIHPSELLETNTTYWFGIIDNTIEYKESDAPVTGVFSTFTTTADAATLVTYNDFEGTSSMSVSESMGETPGAYTIVSDPAGGTNKVQQWGKGNTWGGWERIHFQLNNAFDASKDGVFSFRIYSPITTNFMFKVANAKEDGDQTASLDKYGEVLVANEWQTVYLDTSELASDVSMEHVFIFIGPGQADITGTFYIDDIMGPQLQGTASVYDAEMASFQFFPNPANDMIRFSNLEGEKVIRIFDVNSKEVLKKTIDTNELSIKNLKPGFYFLEINGQFKKLIKE